MKIRPRINPYLQVIDPTCFQNCRNFCLLTAFWNELLLGLCVAGCFGICSD